LRWHKASTDLDLTLGRQPIPNPSFLDSCISLGAFNGERRWKSMNGKRLYTWDGLHGEIEAFNSRGMHVAVLDAVTGVPIKNAVPGRKINV